jgi:outer membrane protein insertion porin family
VSSQTAVVDRDAPAVTFLITEGPLVTISEIRFEGNRVFPDEALATKFKECFAENDGGRRNVFQSSLFEYCKHRLANFERSEGYLKAKLGEPRIQEVGDGLIITVEADEGLLYRFGSLEIDGAHHVAEQDIRAIIDMRPGDVANGEKLSKALYQDLKAIYGEKGFIQYTAEIIPTFHSEPGTAEGVVDFDIIIDEGRRFRIRKIFLKGEALPENDLRQMLLFREGEVYNQKLLEESIKRINDTGWFYLLDKDKDVDYRTNEEEGLLDITIRVTRRP